MEKQYIHIDRIEQYLGGNMEVEERIAFEEELQKDVQLRKEYELLQRAHLLFLTEEMGMLKQQIKTDLYKQRQRKYIRWGVGACIALLTGGFVFYTVFSNRKKEQPSSEQETQQQPANLSDSIYMSPLKEAPLERKLQQGSSSVNQSKIHINESESNEKTNTTLTPLLEQEKEPVLESTPDHG